MEHQVKCKYCPKRGKGPDPGTHLNINRAKGVYVCFRCDAKGKLKFNMNPKELKFGNRGFIKKKVKDVEIYTFRLNTKTSRTIKQYLKERGLDKEVIKRVRWSPIYPNRAFFTIYGHSGLRFWTARTIIDEEPKYLSSGAKTKFVYGIEEIDSDWAVLCEGPLDALSCTNGVAIFGKYPSDAQVMLLSNKVNTLYIALDGDADRSVIYKKFPKWIKLVEVELGKDEDPNSVGRAGMDSRVIEAGLRDDGKEKRSL